MKRKKVGIYAIVNAVTGKMYVGQSVDIAERFIRHRYQLNKGTHKNKHLLRAWRKYGSDNFEFKILQECNADQLGALEKNHRQ